MTSKRWLYTSFDLNLDVSKFENILFYVQQNEICPKTKKEHIQGYLEVSKNIRISGLKKLNESAHWTKAKGTAEHNITYCSKDGGTLKKHLGSLYQVRATELI